MGKIWNGSTFEGATAANYARYPVLMVESSTLPGLYQASFPTAAPAGVYSWVAVEQAGGSPASSDYPGKVFATANNFQWSGTAEVSITRIAIDDLGRVTLAASGLDSILIEGTANVRQVIGLLASILCGKVSGLNTNTPSFKALGGSATRVVAATDQYGNRTSVNQFPES